MANFGYAHIGEGGEDDEAEEDIGFQAWGNQRDGLIFLIDASKQMFDAPDDDDCLFQLCLKIAKTTMQNKIISSERDLIGTVFFGTEKSENPSEFKNIYVFQKLEQPGAQRILDLEMYEGDGIKQFSRNFGHSATYSLSEALWTCNNMFSEAEGSQKMGSKRVMLFTNNDNPHAGSAHMRNQAEAKASDLANNGIDLDLMHLQNPGQTFDITKFYKPLLLMDDDELTELPAPAERMEELLRRVRSKEHKKRALRRIPFSLGTGLKFSVGVYKLVGSCTKPPAVKLSKRDNAELRSVSKTYDPETGEILMPQDMKKAQTYGGKAICFENDEVADIKRFDDAGFYLLGFKPRSCLKDYFHFKSAQFIYPDENSITGSTTMFTALLARCLARDVTPICKYIPGRNSPPEFAALMPQAEEVDEQKVQITPPGFHVIFLPYSDHFRKVFYDQEAPRANEDQINAAKAVVRKLTFPFSSESFENPVLQNHWRNVEAYALARDHVDELQDHLLPNVENILKRAGPALEDFKAMVFPADYVPGAKRKAGGAAGAAKKVKPDLGTIDVRAEAAAGRLGKLTVADLKNVIKAESIATGATKKADLIDAITNHFGV